MLVIVQRWWGLSKGSCWSSPPWGVASSSRKTACSRRVSKHDMRRPAQLSSHLAARSPYWTLVLLLQYLHLALGRPAPPSEEEDAPAANDDGAGGVAVKEEQKPTATAAPSTAKNEAEKSSSTETATAAWATQTSGGMQQSSDKQDTIILHSDASLS